MKQRKYLKRLIAEHFVEPMKYTNLQTQEIQHIPSRIYKKEPTPRHIMAQLQKNKRKNKSKTKSKP